MEAGESKYISLILRHQTLYESNLDLFENLIANADKLKMMRIELERIVIGHNSNVMEINRKLSEMQKIKDDAATKNTREEERITNERERNRQRIVDLSRIFWGIDNLAEKSVTSTGSDKYKMNVNQLSTMSVYDKLSLIRNYMSRQNIIINAIQESDYLPTNDELLLKT